MLKRKILNKVPRDLVFTCTTRKITDLARKYSASQNVTYDGKAPMFSLCVGAIHLTSCVKIQKHYSMKISEREACRNKNTN